MLKLLSALIVAAFLCACRPPARAGDKLVILQTEAPRTMDPADHTETYTTAVLNPMYEGLARFNQDLQVVPVLATSWHSSANALDWTVSLRPDVRFHDGSPLNAAAVAASFQRLMDPNRGLAGATSVRRAVRSVSIVDPMTVIFHLASPFAAFPRILASTPIVSAKADHDGYLSRHAVGTGPYRFVEWKTSEYVLESRNPDYWGKPLRPSELRWMWTTEPALMNMTLQAGEVDVVNPMPPVFADALRHNGRARLLKGVSSAVFWVALNTRYRPLSDVRVRQALNYATDRANLVASQLRGYGEPARSPLAPAIGNYDSGITGYPFDLKKAQALMRAAGYAHGFELNLAVLENQVNFAEALQGMWQRIHVTLTIQRLESGTFAQVIFGSPEQKAAGHVDAVFASWASPTLDAERQLGPLYRSRNFSPAGANLGFYSNAKLDDLLDRAGAELDPARQHALYKEAQQLISGDAPHVVLFYPSDLAAMRHGLRDLWLFPGGQLELAE